MVRTQIALVDTEKSSEGVSVRQSRWGQKKIRSESRAVKRAAQKKVGGGWGGRDGLKKQKRAKT